MGELKQMNNKQFSNKQEKDIAKAIGGKKQANSGATRFKKGDIENTNFLIEAKTMAREKESFTVKKEWLEQIRLESIGMRKSHYALSFNFGGLECSKNFYIIDERTFKLLNELLEKEYE
jgi:hypothetical protein